MRYLALLFAFAAVAPAADPDLPDGTAQAKQTIAALKPPPGFTVELFAAEPKLGSPVAIALDDQNRVYVAEEYRLGRGTPENRDNPAFKFSFFLDDDLQVRTLADRLAMYKKWEHRLPGGADWFTKHGDQVRLLQDTDGDGKADKATVFAGPFNAPLDGLAAGVLAHDGDVFLTCIPSLWKLRDTTGTGVADKKEALLTGFGVSAAFFGHDLHGLVVGPDGKLYFSIGDRGFNVETKEGTTLTGLRTGAVFRCNLDGTELEVVHRGLRNPQELAFDQYGNLFADDNNCDKGDHARLVYVVDGGESGWNMAYQTIPAPYMTGPWFAERLWHLQHPGQPAYLVPPVAKLGAGPSGFAFSSGTAMPDRYKNTFFMCNYTGNGGVEAFKVRPKGAGFEIDDYHPFLTPVRATDVAFGTDGKMYVSDFVNLIWAGGSAGGRVYTAFDPERVKSTDVVEMKKLFAEGFKKLSPKELGKLLEHPDQRVRQRAQFALAKLAIENPNDRAALLVLLNTLDQSKNQMARIHSIWGLGQIQGKVRNDGYAGLIVKCLRDPDPEIRAQTVKFVGDDKAKWDGIGGVWVGLLFDPSPRVRFFAAQTLGRSKHKDAIAPLFDLLADNKDADVYIRHAAVTALARIGAADAAAGKTADPSAAVRMGAVLVLRKLQDKRLAGFLADADPYVRIEAGRAIHDLPIESAYQQLADELPKLAATPIPDGDMLARRAISAAYRLGGADRAKAVLGVVTNANFSSAVRAEALAAIRDWAEPPPRDRVTGFWRPLANRDAAEVRKVVEPAVPALLAGTSGRLQADVVGLLLKLGAAADETTFAAWATDPKKDPNTRVAAVRLLAERKAKQAGEVLDTALKDASPLVRAEARDFIAKENAGRGVELFAGLLTGTDAPAGERQRAVAGLTGLKANADAGKLLDGLAADLAAGKLPADLHVDALEAIKAAPSAPRDKARQQYEGTLPKTPTGKFFPSLHGGDAERGRDLFFGHTAAQCVRCHTVNKVGGTAGPDLSQVVTRNPAKTREYLLESVIEPSAKIAAGFATVNLTLIDGRVVTGVVEKEDAKALTIKTPDGRTVTVDPADIEKRTQPESPMPSVERTLTPREVRDLVEFLSTLK